MRTCWKQLSPFRETGQVLKLRYDTAVKVSSATNEALGRLELWAPPKPGSPTKGLAPRPGDLVYMEDSPSFCRPSKYSLGTAGRVQQLKLQQPVLWAWLRHPEPHGGFLLPLSSAVVLLCGVPAMLTAGACVYLQALGLRQTRPGHCQDSLGAACEHAPADAHAVHKSVRLISLPQQMVGQPSAFPNTQQRERKPCLLVPGSPTWWRTWGWRTD